MKRVRVYDGECCYSYWPGRVTGNLWVEIERVYVRFVRFPTIHESARMDVACVSVFVVVVQAFVPCRGDIGYADCFSQRVFSVCVHVSPSVGPRSPYTFVRQVA